MSDGIYVALTGAMARVRQLEALSNNLANVDTTAYRRLRPAFREFLGRGKIGQQAPDASMPSNKEMAVDLVHVVAQGTAESKRAGVMRQTDAELDLALEGDGFFVVKTEAGLRYTRNGHFKRDQDGFLTTLDGAKVMGEQQAIQLQQQGRVMISHEGIVTLDGQQMGQLRRVDFENPTSLVREGANRYSSTAKPQAAQPRVMQGYLESSNVNPLREMVELISTHRSFDTIQQAIRSYREMDNRANEIGRP